ncbi:unnamed protein product [Larinioides sclopetarius]|uniref:BED-type domain-containing protein n=1 Tax=Larinioides sclopetarius TaxID=280406 RepID=A0AAV2C0S4_9ARAC
MSDLNVETDDMDKSFEDINDKNKKCLMCDICDYFKMAGSNRGNDISSNKMRTHR